MNRCGHCGQSVRVATSQYWRSRRFCNYDCSHAAGDRTHCDEWNCPCTAYSKLHRVTRGLLEGMQILRTELLRLDADPEIDYHEIDQCRLNLPYFADVHNRIEDADGDDSDADQMDPDRERRGMASQTALVDAVAVIVNHRENKRRRLEIESKLESTRLNLERKAMQLENLMSRQLRA